MRVPRHQDIDESSTPVCRTVLRDLIATMSLMQEPRLPCLRCTRETLVFGEGWYIGKEEGFGITMGESQSAASTPFHQRAGTLQAARQPLPNPYQSLI